MKRVLFCMVAIIVSMSTYAQGEKYGYWNGDKFYELTPDESCNYKFVQALDEGSVQTLTEPLIGKRIAEDESVIRVEEDKFYVLKDYTLPEGNYYVSTVYKRVDDDQALIVLPKIIMCLQEGFPIDDLLEQLGSNVTAEKIEGEYDLYNLICQMGTSEEVLEVIQKINALLENGECGISHYFPSIKDLDVYPNDLPATFGVTPICEQNWEGVRYEAFVEIGPRPWETTDEGLAITVPSEAEPWNPMTYIAYNFSLEKGHNYIVRLTMKAPQDGTYHVGLGELGGAWYSCEVPVTASNDFQVIDVECADFPGNVWREGLVMLGCGKVVGTTVVKKVQIYEVNNSNSKETGIEDVKTVNRKKADGAIYNLAGQKVTDSYKGIVIKNGKRYVKK